MHALGCPGNYGSQNDRQHLLAAANTPPVKVVTAFNNVSMSNERVPGNPSVAAAASQVDTGPNYATLSPKNTMGKMLTKAAPSQPHASKVQEAEPLVRVNTYEDINNCEVDQRFFIGQARIHVESAEVERGRQHNTLPRSQGSRPREAPPPPIRKVPPQEPANQALRPVSEEFPPPPPYTETDTDPIADNIKNAYTYRVKCS